MYKYIRKLIKKFRKELPRIEKPKNNYDPLFFSRGIEIDRSNYIDKSLLLLIEKIGRPGERFILSKDDICYIDKNSHTQNGIKLLTLKIFRHIKMPYIDYEVMITVGTPQSKKVFTVDGSGNVAKNAPNDGKAGMYSLFHDKPCITINIEDYYSLDTIIAITCHECMHHFLRSKHVEFSDKFQNEILTDVATVYMGFGEYMKKGYETINIYEEGIQKMITVGYIKVSQIKSTIKKIKIISKNYIEEQKRKQNIALLKENAVRELDSFRDVYNRYEFCVSTVIKKGDVNLTAEDFSSLQGWLMSSDYDRGLEQQLVHDMQAIRNEDDAVKFTTRVVDICTDLTRRMVILSKYF